MKFKKKKFIFLSKNSHILQIMHMNIFEVLLSNGLIRCQIIQISLNENMI